MDTLKNNLNNSPLLPYDIMYLIYEFADNLKPIRNQIENKEYDLDEIMYKRMKKYIISRSIFEINHYLRPPNSWNMIEINENNINDIKLKNNLLNDGSGYKYLFLRKVTMLTKICGLDPSSGYSYHSQMVKDLSCSKTYYNYSNSFKEFYQEWVKL